MYGWARQIPILGGLHGKDDFQMGWMIFSHYISVLWLLAVVKYFAELSAFNQIAAREGPRVGP
jgi:hypothetical protein